jgi:hypothetical protein
MATKTSMAYSLEDINTIMFDGFDYKLPAETLKIISKLSSQVGSPDYIKTPVFQKRENTMKSEILSPKEIFKKKRGKPSEIINEEDWNNEIKPFQIKQIDEKNGVDAKINIIRTHLNKLSDKNYETLRNKIIEIIDTIINENNSLPDLERVGSIIFDIASTNKFYSKIYANLYSELSSKYLPMMEIFNNNFNKFIELFNNIEYVDPNIDYNKFCEINKINEKRKSLATFYLNLMKNGIIPKNKILEIAVCILSQIYSFISIENKKNEVDELTETFSIFYLNNKYMFKHISLQQHNNLTVEEIIGTISKSTANEFLSLSNKSLFKFMDLFE